MKKIFMRLVLHFWLPLIRFKPGLALLLYVKYSPPRGLPWRCSFEQMTKWSSPYEGPQCMDASSILAGAVCLLNSAVELCAWWGLSGNRLLVVRTRHMEWLRMIQQPPIISFMETKWLPPALPGLSTALSFLVGQKLVWCIIDDELWWCSGWW